MREHVHAATCLQRRQRGAVARVFVCAVRLALDQKWFAKYGHAPTNVKVVRTGDHFMDLTWDMPIGMGLGKPHVSTRELGARLLTEGRAAVGIGGGVGGSDSATAGVTPSLGDTRTHTHTQTHTQTHTHTYTLSRQVSRATPFQK